MNIANILKRGFSTQPTYNHRIWAVVLMGVTALSFISHLKSEYHRYSNKKLRYLLKQNEKEKSMLYEVINKMHQN